MLVVVIILVICNEARRMRMYACITESGQWTDDTAHDKTKGKSGYFQKRSRVPSFPVTTRPTFDKKRNLVPISLVLSPGLLVTLLTTDQSTRVIEITLSIRVNREFARYIIQVR